jgi:hypothetical protein
MPVLNPSELNIVVSVAGGFLLAFGIISVKLKQTWYLGEACKLSTARCFLASILTACSAGYAVRYYSWSDSWKTLANREMGYS